jgi:hypothetical protein
MSSAHPPQQPYGQQPYGQQQPYPQQPYPHQPPPKKRRTGLIVLAVIGGVLVLGPGGCIALVVSVGNGIEESGVTATAGPAATESEVSADEPADEPSEEPADEPSEEPDEPSGEPYKVTITKCARGEFGTFDVVVKIKNNSDTEATYLFDVGLYDPKDNTVGSGFGSVEVRPEKSATTETFASLTDPDYKGKVKCEVEVTDF